MRDLDRHPRHLADSNRLAYRIEQAACLVAHMTRVKCATAPHLACKLDNFLRCCIAAGFIYETGGEPECACVKRLAKPAPHRRHLSRVRRTWRIAHCGSAKCPMPHQYADVAARWITIEHLEVSSIILPFRHVNVAVNRVKECTRCHVRRRAHTAVPDHIGSHSLHHFEIHLGSKQDGEIVVTMDVDEAGGERKALAVNLDSTHVANLTQLGNSVVCYRQIRDKRLAAGSIENCSAANDYVPSPVRHVSISPLGRIFVSSRAPSPCWERVKYVGFIFVRCERVSKAPLTNARTAQAKVQPRSRPNQQGHQERRARPRDSRKDAPSTATFRFRN